MNADQAIAHELFVDDVYRAGEVFEPTDRWLDVGCHHGWFTKLAQVYGAGVVAGVDRDGFALTKYANVNPISKVEQVDSSNSLAKLVDRFNPTAVKLDIQGAERFLIRVDGLEWARGSIIDKLLLEWHQPTILHLVDCLEAFGFMIQFADRHVDVLTGEDTYIVYAVRS